MSWRILNGFLYHTQTRFLILLYAPSFYTGKLMLKTTTQLERKPSSLGRFLFLLKASRSNKTKMVIIQSDLLTNCAQVYFRNLAIADWLERCVWRRKLGHAVCRFAAAPAKSLNCTLWPGGENMVEKVVNSLHSLTLLSSQVCRMYASVNHNLDFCTTLNIMDYLHFLLYALFKISW